MTPSSLALGIDFGTSNSSAGYLLDGRPRLIEMTPGRTSLPTTFFFDFDTRETLIGEPANAALLEGADGRFMRALKRVLGTSLMHEKRQILNDRLTFVEIIGRFLAEMKARSEAATGVGFERALSGRPVVFHGANDPREAQAEADLRACYLAAGFASVEFMAEPEAAAIASGGDGPAAGTGLIVDIGGGTSDFSVFRPAGRDGGVAILANHGIRVGGTDFDRAVSIDRVMPLLGRGSPLRHVMGSGVTTAPNAIFNDLATWEKIPFLYTARTRRSVAEMQRLAEAPERIGRLATVLHDELGHDIAFAVEAGKIAANDGAPGSRIALDPVAPGLSASLTAEALTTLLAPHAEQLRAAAEETMRRAGLAPSSLDRVIYVGGSSLMSVVPRTMRALFPQAEHSFAEVFTAVADGLAIAGARD